MARVMNVCSFNYLWKQSAKREEKYMSALKDYHASMNIVHELKDDCMSFQLSRNQH